jgi:hypothetical protein
LVQELPVILLGLDPYAGLYLCTQDNVITTSVDEPTAADYKRLGAKDIRVTGPILAMPIIKARVNALKRIAEVKSGAPLKITIATGGNLTHGDQIAALAREFAKQTTSAQIAKIWIVAGDSPSIREDSKAAFDGDERFQVIFHKDPAKLVSLADEAMGQSDIIIAKTGELAFTVAGGKAFKTFFMNPSLAPQEVAIREYNRLITTVDNLSALEFGIEPVQEVARILQQQRDGTLAKMMENGLLVPADGANKVVAIAKQILAKNESG